MTAANPFHLAIAVNDFGVTLAFYEDYLGCSRGRESHSWVDLNFFGHQLVLHKADDSKGRGATGANLVDGEQVPVPHFGVVLEWPAFEALIERLVNQDCEFVVEPITRFKGRAGEQKTCFLLDPSGNCLEFKSFRDPDALFSTDAGTYA